MKIIVLALLLVISVSSQAIDIQITQTGCDTSGDLTIAFCNQITSEAETIANQDLPDIDISQYADGSAKAISYANSGKGSDYGQDFELFTLKGSLGLGVDASTSGFSEVIETPTKAGGFAVGGGVTAGINLNAFPIKKMKYFDFSKLDLFLNFSALSIDKDFGEASAKGSIGGFGFMARYTIVDPMIVYSRHLIEWGGVQLHTGFQRSSMNVDYSLSFDDEIIDLDVGLGNSLNGTFNNTVGTFELSGTSTTIPIEISTYARFLYVFTLYGGMGLDITSASSDIEFSGKGNISAGVNTDSGEYTASLSASQASEGEFKGTNLRTFIGLQLNVPVVSLFLHVNKHLSEEIFGLNAGINIAW